MLSFKDSLEVPEKAGATIYLVTEPVKPLALVMQELDLAGQHRCAAARAAYYVRKTSRAFACCFARRRSGG